MSGAIGLVLGSLLGIASYRVLSRLADKAENQGSATLLRRLALAELVTMPIIGTIIGGFVIGN